MDAVVLISYKQSITKMGSSSDNNKNLETNPRTSDFSIDHILNRAGNNVCVGKTENGFCDRVPQHSFNLDTFSWLNCTRYCPPKIPRNHVKKAPQKRQLGRHPRIPFTSYQLSILEEKFQQTPYLTGEEVVELSNKLQLVDIRVKIWFQNRRARDRREKFSIETGSEDRGSPTKNQSENVVPKLHFFPHKSTFEYR